MRGIFLLLLITVVCAAAVFWLFFSDVPVRHAPVPQRTDVETPDAESPAQPGTADPAGASETTGRAEPEVPEVVGPPIVVDSYARDAQAALANWGLINEPLGYFDILVRERDNAKVDPGLSLSPDDILVAQGWAGDRNLGVRFNDVVLSACERIVARGQVSRERPDVASAVHPNLLVSGWTVRVLAEDIAGCEEGRMRAWAVVPGMTAALAPLAESHAFTAPQPAGNLNRVSAQADVAPSSYEKPEFATIRVTADRVNVRSCGSTSCGVVMQIDRGTYRAYLATQGPEWTLILTPEIGGWLFNDLFQLER